MSAGTCATWEIFGVTVDSALSRVFLPDDKKANIQDKHSALRTVQNEYKIFGVAQVLIDRVCI